MFNFFFLAKLLSLFQLKNDDGLSISVSHMFCGKSYVEAYIEANLHYCHPVQNCFAIHSIVQKSYCQKNVAICFNLIYPKS